jgi:hypothetical protein
MMMFFVAFEVKARTSESEQTLFLSFVYAGMLANGQREAEAIYAMMRRSINAVTSVTSGTNSNMPRPIRFLFSSALFSAEPPVRLAYAPTETELL